MGNKTPNFHSSPINPQTFKLSPMGTWNSHKFLLQWPKISRVETNSFIIRLLNRRRCQVLGCVPRPVGFNPHPTSVGDLADSRRGNLGVTPRLFFQLYQISRFGVWYPLQKSKLGLQVIASRSSRNNRRREKLLGNLNKLIFFLI